MKKAIKFFVAILVIIVMCVTSAVSVFASANIPEATLDFYVNDFAGVFSEEEKSKLMNNAVTLAKENDGIQVVVTTVKSLDGETVEDYAYDMYNKYGIGKDDMGLLILLSTGDRQIRVEVGKAMEAYVNDAKAGRFMDKYAIPLLKENKFNEGLISLQEALITEVKTCVVTGTIDDVDKKVNISIDWSSVFLVLGIILLVGVVVFVIILIAKKVKSKKEYVEGLEDEVKRLKAQKISMQESHEANTEALRSINSELKYDKDELQTECKQLNDKLKELKDRHCRLLTIYPDADEKIDAMIKAERIAKDKEKAKEVDDLIKSVIDLLPSKDIVGKVESVLSNYNLLTDGQKQYVEADIRELKDLYSFSLQLKKEHERKLEEERIRQLTEQRKNKAEKVTKELLAVIALVGVARASDLYKLRDAKSLYDNLDYETKKFVDKAAISKLDSLLSDAKRRKDEEEEEERRRRRASYHSSSSFGGGSSFGGHGGFGGRSGGGGSSRGF